MRLLFVHDRFGDQAGAESNLFHTATELKWRGHEVALAHGPGTNVGEERWREVFPARYSLHPDRTGASTCSALSDFEPDAVYLHNALDLQVVEALAERTFPVVRMIHDHQLFCLRGCRYSIWSRRPCTRAFSPYCVFPCGGFLGRSGNGNGRKLNITRYSSKKRELKLHHRFHRLVVASEYMRTELMRNGFDGSRIEIHAPVPPQPQGEASEPTFNGRNLIVYAGQIVRGKGVDKLLEALARVRTPFECIILGEGHHRPYCEAQSRRLGLTDRVRFPGYVPQAQLAEYYREATVSVVSSVWPEPFGATGLEAMRMGLPVVAFDVGGIGEWLHDGVNGFLVPWMDCGQYARSLEMLLEDKDLARRLGAQGRTLAAERFGFRRYVSGLESLFVRIRKERIGEFVA